MTFSFFTLAAHADQSKLVTLRYSDQQIATRATGILNCYQDRALAFAGPATSAENPLWLYSTVSRLASKVASCPTIVYGANVSGLNGPALYVGGSGS